MTDRISLDIEKLLALIGQIKLGYSIDDLVETTPLSRAHWYGAINSEKLPAVKAGDKTVILVWDLFAYLKALPHYCTASGKEERSKQAAALRACRESRRTKADAGGAV